jgi:octaprenyl-diphosphate synthase
MFVAATKADDVAVSIPASAAEPGICWRKIVGPIESFLELTARRLADQVSAFEPEIAPYAQYALSNQGKQLRPALVALSAGRSRHTSQDDLVTVAVIIEMIHLATLVHDDVMDEASIRRRRPTLARNWGNSISVLLGDCLFAHALRLASDFPTTEVCRAVAGATRTVCSGEILQSIRQGRFELARPEYFRILRMKTGELFALSCDLGAWVAGADEAERQTFRNYGLNLGTAYQLYDDCLDIFGTEKVAGKSLGTDLANGKLTLPVLVAMERTETADGLRMRELLGDWNIRHVKELVGLLEKHGALNESRHVIHHFLDLASGSLQQLRNPTSQPALQGLCAFLAQQTMLLGVR